MSDYEIPAATAARLRELAETARNVRGTTPADSPLRDASATFSALLADERSRGATFVQLGAACGMSWSAVKQRLGRYGYHPLQPSQAHTKIGDR